MNQQTRDLLTISLMMAAGLAIGFCSLYLPFYLGIWEHTNVRACGCGEYGSENKTEAVFYGVVWDPQTQQVVPFPYNLSDKYTFKVLVLEYLNDKGSGTAGDEGNLPERDSVLLDKVAQENLESGKNTVRVRGSNPQEALYTFMEFADPDLGSQINHFQLELSIVKFNKGSYGIATAAEGTVYSVCIVTSTPGKQHIEKDIDGVYHIVTDEPEIRYLFDDNHRPNEIEQDS